MQRTLVVIPWIIASMILLSGCTGEDPTPALDELAILAPIETHLTYLKDDQGRYLTVRGINVSGSTKWPPTEVFGTTTDDVSYVGDPFPLDEADQWFGLLQAHGFSAIRLIMMWEAIEPHEKGVYDEEYLDYLEAIVQKAADHGIYVLMDMHQDLFTRHLYVKYNEDLPDYVDPTGIDGMLMSLFPAKGGGYSNWVRGDGAPRWAVQACLPEKQMDSPHWGKARLLGGLNGSTIAAALGLYNQLTPPSDEGGEIPKWVDDILAYSADPFYEEFGIDETSDMLPWTFWGINHALSSDVERMYACITAGRDVFPSLEVDGQNIQDYLSEAYAAAFAEVAKRVGKYDNVIGYDLMNEPGGMFIMMTLLSAYFATGSEDGLEATLQDLAGEQLGSQLWDLVVGLNLLPPDATDETKAKWGYSDVDLFKVIGLNLGYDANYQEPFYSLVGQAIQAEDPDAVIWIESPGTVDHFLLGGGYGNFETIMKRPEGIDQLVYAPHWYPDIYPFPGFNQEPRTFSVEQVQHRDYTDSLAEATWIAEYSLGNVPVIFGEFGTYYNFNGIEQSIADDYLISSHILDNYYEAFEGLGLGQMLWCFSADNSYDDGDGWNKEDFSMVDPNGAVRSEEAYTRPYAKLLAGKPLESHFYSDYHYFDPDKGQVDPLHEFEVTYASKETDAPSVIFTAEAVQYPDGFYVWLSDGYAVYDDERQLLYHYPTADEPGTVHSVRLLPPLEGQAYQDWDYFIDGALVVDGPARGGK